MVANNPISLDSCSLCLLDEQKSEGKWSLIILFFSFSYLAHAFLGCIWFFADFLY